MSVWTHQDSSVAGVALNPDLSVFIGSRVSCRYCKCRMDLRQISDYWRMNPSDYIKDHAQLVDFSWMVHEQGMTLDELELCNGDPGDDVYCSALVCDGCGWWVLVKQVLLSAKARQIWDLTYGTCGRLRNLDIAEISTPANEVRNYLRARYNSRFDVHPRKFEEVVASVFNNFGYDTKLTSYSNDGGIDVILSGPDHQKIGVQVKRHRGRIAVEQIRSFLGALIVNDCVRGYFVTTSIYQSGARTLANTCKEYHRPISLINSELFFEMLQVSELPDLNEDYPFSVLGTVPRVQPVADFHLNSL